MKLVDWPVGLWARSITPTAGPNSRGSTESITGDVQTVESPYGLVGLAMEFPPLQGRAARAFRGLVTALHAGANAVRVPWVDPYQPSYEELGTSVTKAEELGGVTWSNGLPWSNGQNWQVSPPFAAVETAAAVRATVVELDVAAWGGEIYAGTTFGFVGQFGLYTAKSVTMAGTVATVEIWPSLRKAITTDDYVTLRPVIAMRLKSSAGGQFSSDLAAMDSVSLDLIEIPDAVLRANLS
ncbi:hypothetical protein [Mongoliimonas terrestris]|uniref:hypothetical protein n=1 Tax=Mongoliimonas terrestris TaxID=1709001 RepID=UPI0009499F61|nr:hypothetical protein [Mongoliimonas terrestris]